MAKLRPGITLRQIEALDAVATTGSFTAAARKLGLSQPTVSEQISSLEEALGVKLLDRRHRGVSLSRLGQVFVGHARRLLHERDEAVEAVASSKTSISGVLAVAASTIPGAYLLPEVLARFCRRHPLVRPTVLIRDSEGALGLLDRGAATLAVIGLRPDPGRYRSSRIASDRVLLVARAGHPLTRGRSAMPVRALGDHPLVLREPGSGTRRAVERAFARAGVHLARENVLCELGSTEAVRQAVRSGLGLGFLSDLAAREDVENGSLSVVRIRNIRVERSFYLVQRADASPTAVERTFEKALRGKNRERE